MKQICSFVLLLVACHFFSCATKTTNALPLIPQPNIVEWSEDWSLFEYIKIEAASEFSNEANFMTQMYPLVSTEQSGKILNVKLLKGQVKNPHNIKGAYRLSVGEEVEIKAADRAGLFYGIQTLRQLVRQEGSMFKIAHCKIEDWPAFKVRGYMQDVGRNYQTPEILKEQIDILGAYKYNVFHLHLTDNPGWRLESKIYPELQSDKATSRKPGKYYSQKEFIDIVNYCKKRHITVIPEFEMPGHSLAFRKAFNIHSMNSPEVQQILMDLIDELCALVPAEEMPYIHLGTDEVRHKEEKVDHDFLVPLFERIRSNGREIIGWRPGMDVPGDSTSVKQLWTGTSVPPKGHPFIDSRANYINHLDALAGMYRIFYQQPCRQPNGDEYALGGILCLWHDNRIDDERNVLRQNPTYPAIVMYSEAIWNGKKKSYGQKYWAQLPARETPEYNAYLSFEDKVITHRNIYFKGKEFPYVKNAHIPWRIIGPFDHKGDLTATFPVEEEMKEEYLVDGKTYTWRDSSLYGGTVHLRHFFGFPSPVKEARGTVYARTNVWSPKDQEVDFWIGFHGWSRSGGRRGGPAPEQGQWHATDPKIWINDVEIPPPYWKQPGLAKATPEIPFVDEDYFYREPSKVKLKKGWNKILLKVPHGGTSWKWMFTCVPVEVNGTDVRELEGLKFQRKQTK